MEKSSLNSQDLSKRMAITSKVVALITCAIGLYSLFNLGILLFRFSKQQKHLSDILFLFIFPVPLFLFSLFCLFLAYNSWQKITSKITREFCFILALISAVTFSSLIFPIDSHKTLFIGVFLMLSGGIFYLIYTKLSMKWLNLSQEINWHLREKYGKLYLRITAFTVWIALMQTITDLAPKDPKFTHIPKDWWWDIITFLLILPIYLLYKLALRQILIDKPQTLS